MTTGLDTEARARRLARRALGLAALALFKWGRWKQTVV